MGLFDRFKKQDCEICGKEVGMFGYKKLEDGEICKDCVKLLSPWFDDRRHSTVAQIKQQISYREENRAALNGFRPTISYGECYALRAELTNGVPTRFVIERNNDYREENADIINFRDVTSFNIDVRESHRELMDRNSEGKEIRYIPPRFEYSYEFHAKIHVNHPYFDDMSFQIFRDRVRLETRLLRAGFDPSVYPEYRQRRLECSELEDLFQAGMRGMPLNGYAPVVQYVVQAVPTPQPTPQAAPAPAGPKFCPNCGAPADGGKFCQSCGSRL